MNPELQKILDTIANPATRKKAEEIFNAAIKGGVELEIALEKVNTQFGRGLDSVQEIQTALRENLKELGNQNVELGIQRKAYRDVGKVLDSIASISAGIIDSDIKQLEKQKQLVQQSKLRLEAIGEFSEADEGIFKDTMDRLEEQIELQENVNKTIGLTGAAFDNLNRIGQRAFGGLGINLGALDESFKDVSKAIREKGEEIAKTTENADELGSLSNRFKTFGAALRPLGKGLKDVFTDPLILLKGIGDAFFDIDKAATSLANTTGQSFKDIIGLSTSTFSTFATAVDLAEVIVAETKQSGLNANNIFSPDVLAGAAEFKNLVGGSAEEIAGLLSLTAATGMNTDLIQESIVDTTSAFNGANRAAISQRQVLQDVLTTSSSIKASFAGNPKALAEAASAARRLGLSLSEVDSIASSLIDFESSITAELEAQLLTGRNINLAKARELALNNDITGLSNEIFKNQVSVAEFSQMNRIQQEGLAKALGMNRDQLAKMAFTQAKLNGLTDEQAAAAAGVQLSDMQRASAMESLNKSLTSLLQIFAPIFDGLSKIVGLAAKFPLLSQGAIAATLAFKMFGNPLTATIGMFGKMYRGALKFLGALKPKSISQIGAAFKGLGTKISSSFKGMDKVDKVSDSLKKVNNASKGIPPSPKAGMGLRFFFENLGTGLGAFGKGAAPAVPVLLSIAAVAAGIGIAFAGLGFGINQAAEGIVNLTNSLTLDKVKTLYAAAGAIGSLSASLASFALFGTLALPALLAVTPLLTALSPAGAAGEAEGQNAMAKIEDKLDILIGAVREERVVKVSIDGKEFLEAVGTKMSSMS